MVAKKIQQIFDKVPEVKYGYADISYSSFSEEEKLPKADVLLVIDVLIFAHTKH